MKSYLYWAKSKEPEDWFIVAPNKEIAAECHEAGEGLNEGDATVELICEIPMDLEVRHRVSEHHILEEGYWPSLELLSELGFQFIEEEPPYILKLGDRVFYQGRSRYELILSELDKAGVYIVNMRSTHDYKIGYSQDIKRRLKELATSNPYAIDLHFFLEQINLERSKGDYTQYYRIKKLLGNGLKLITMMKLFQLLRL